MIFQGQNSIIWKSYPITPQNMMDYSIHIISICMGESINAKSVNLQNLEIFVGNLSDAEKIVIK